MNKGLTFWAFLALSVLMGYHNYAQERESAEVFLEEYTDEFQEHFFEALKQKGIQNYDKAINLFLACKQLDPLSDVIDFQLAKTYYLDKQYIQAQEYGIAALNSKPNDFWYLESLMEIMSKQGSPLETIKDRIPADHGKLKENLALIYFKNQQYKEALLVVEAMENSKFAASLARKIQDSLKHKKGKENEVLSKQEISKKDDPVATYKSQMKTLIGQADYPALEVLTQKAMDSYPLQPYFHYAYGVALNGKSNTVRAIEVLEGALDYLFDDDALANKIYRELSEAYTTIGNRSKANEYLNKIKPGL